MKEALRPLAENVRRLRTQRGLSLSALAREAHISKSTLFKLERCEANPSMDTLWSLASALNVPFASLFVGDSAPTIDIRRFEDAPRVARDRNGAIVARGRKDDPHFVIRHILSRHARGELEAYCVDVDPGVARKAAAHSKDVVEHVFVAHGRITISVRDVLETLAEGDRMSFPADADHTYEALDGRPARIVVLLDYPEPAQPG